MLETKEQKQIFAGSIVLVLILGLVSFFGHPQLQYQDTTNYQALRAQSERKQLAYEKYLASLGTTKQAQTELYNEILPPQEVQKEVAKALDTAQKIVVPTKPQASMKVVAAGGKAAVLSYLNSTNALVDKIQSVTDASKNDLFSMSGSTGQVDSLIQDLSSAIGQYSKISVPKEAADLHSQELIALETYLDLAKTSKSYMSNSNKDPWPQMYKDVVVMTQTSQSAGSSFDALNKKYNILGDAKNNQNLAKGNWLVPAAEAQFAVVDIFQKLETALRIAAATAVTQFMLQFLNQLATKIQQAYTITNYLYYTDALVAGQYVDDYLNKYVNDPLDQTMIKQFIPALSCGQKQDLTPVFQTKANKYLGFDPNSLDPSDPNYYQKLARVGNFLSSPSGWQLYYQDEASQTQSAAQAAANSELLGSGNKSSRDVTGGILTTAQTTVDTMRATIQNMLSSGFAGYSDDPWTAKIASQITQTFLNSFVFKGTVLKEQKACIPVPIVNLVSPLPTNTAPDIQPSAP